MENKNQPAFPIMETKEAQCSLDHKQFYGNVKSIGGLTKREYFAGLAMQGMLTRNYVDRFGDMKGVAEAAVTAADALLAQLTTPLK